MFIGFHRFPSCRQRKEALALLSRVKILLTDFITLQARWKSIRNKECRKVKSIVLLPTERALTTIFRTRTQMVAVTTMQAVDEVAFTAILTKDMNGKVPCMRVTESFVRLY